MDDEQIDYLSGQVDALTKICLTLFVSHPRQDALEPIVQQLSNDLRNTGLPLAHIRGIERVIEKLKLVLQFRDLSVKTSGPTPSKGH